MGRVNRYRRVKRTVQEFGKQRGSKRSDLPLRKPRGNGRDKIQMVNGFMLEPDNNRKLIRKVVDTSKTSLSKKKKGATLKQAKSGEKAEAKDGELKSLKIAPGESLRSFDQRVDIASRGVLADQIRAQTATAKRRKQFMKERKVKSKLKKKMKRERKLASKEEEEAELVYQGLKPFKAPRHDQEKRRKGGNAKAPEEEKEVPTRWVGVHNVVEQPPEFSERGADKKRFTKLKFMGEGSRG